MEPGADPAFRQAMDGLMMKVSRDNVLAVHRAFQDYADDLRLCLRDIDANTKVGLCGADPVSHAAAGPESFGGKVGRLVDIHWKHWEELDAVAASLRAAARTYGHTDDDIARSLASPRTQ